MDTQIEHLLNEAIKLSPSQRVNLADALLDSIPTAKGQEQASLMDPTIGRAWGKEVARRIADVDAGRVEMIPVEKALPKTKKT